MAVGRNSIPNGNVTKELESVSAAAPPELFPFIRIPIIIVCTIVVFILFIAGTATTAISYPPKPPVWVFTTSGGHGLQEVTAQETALDGDFKLLGPLLLTAGCFLLIVDVALCVIVTREAYHVSRAIRPYSNDVNTGRPVPVPLAIAGGPFYIVTTDPAVTHMGARMGRWGHPNAPTPDFSLDGGSLKGSRARAATALARERQPPFNPNIGVRDGDA